jgi:hypothetical protein
MRIYWCESTEHAVDTFMVARNRGHAAELHAELACCESEDVILVSYVRRVPKGMEHLVVEETGEPRPELLKACGGRQVGFLGEAPLLRRLRPTWEKALREGTLEERIRAQELLHQLREGLNESWRQVWSFDGRVHVPMDDLLCLVQLEAGGFN